MGFWVALKSITGIFSSPFKDLAEILVHTAAPAVESHDCPVCSRLWHCGANIQRESGGRHAEIEHFCDVRIGWAKVRTWKRNKRATTKPRGSLNSCVKHPPTEQREEKSIPTHARPRQHQVYSTVKTKQEKTRERAQEETSRGREWWSTFWRPTLLPIVAWQLPIPPPMHNADVLSNRDLLLIDLVVLSSQISHLLQSVCRND